MEHQDPVNPLPVRAIMLLRADFLFISAHFSRGFRPLEPLSSSSA